MLALDDVLALLDDSPFGVSVSRRSDGVVVYANRAFTAMLGVATDAYVGTTARGWYVDDAQRAAIVRRLKAEGGAHDVETQFRRSDGSAFWVLMTVREGTLAGEPVNLAWLADITQRKKAESHMRLAAAVVETANEGIVVTDAAGRIETVNGAFTRLTGYAADEVIGNSPAMLASGRHDRTFFAEMWHDLNRNGRWQGEVWNRRKDGAVYVEWLSIAAVRDANGVTAHYLGVFTDITARKETEERVWRKANFDALTGLPNRALFLDRLSQTERQARREGNSFALLYIDLDNFKAVNDTLGHAAGDHLLQLAASRLIATVRASDTVARLSGDEFTIILDRISSARDAENVARKVVDKLAQPFDLDGSEAWVAASVGIALYPDHGEDPKLLRHLADQAMYSVKRNGKNGYAFHGAAPFSPLDSRRREAERRKRIH